MRRPLANGKKAGEGTSPAQSVERLVNGYLERVTSGKEPDPIYGSPGLVLFATSLHGRVRGFCVMANTLYAVAGMRLYSITSAGVATELGSVPGTADVPMATDGEFVVLVAENEIHVWDGSTLNAVTDPDAPNAASVVWTDGFFVFGETGTEQYFISELNDPEDYDALDFQSAEWKPDNIVTPFMVKRTLFLGGEKTIEAQQNVGGADFPFARYEDVFIDVGLAGKFAVTVTNDAPYFLANDNTIRRLDGLTAVKISDAAVTKIIEGWSDKSLTIATSHVWGDHLFITFRNPDGCIEYDQATEQWHERQSDDSDTWRCNHYARCYDLHLFGSADEGKIYKLDASTYDEDGDILPFEMVTPYAYDGGKKFQIQGVEAVAEAGVGSLTLNPQISLETTKNGQDWGPRAYRRLGLTGNRDRRAMWGPKGDGRSMALKLRITDPVKRAILGVWVDMEVEP